MYSPDKLKLIIKTRTDKNLFENDHDFPNDEMERWYGTPVGKEVMRSTDRQCFQLLKTWFCFEGLRGNQRDSVDALGGPSFAQGM